MKSNNDFKKNKLSIKIKINKNLKEYSKNNKNQAKKFFDKKSKFNFGGHP